MIRRKGFTLTELLVVLSIIAVLTSSMAMAVRGAQERARENRTAALMSRIENVLQREVLDAIELPSPTRTPSPLEGNWGINTHVNLPNEGLFTISRRFRAEATRVQLLTKFPYKRELSEFGAAASTAIPVHPAGSATPGFPAVDFRLNNGDYELNRTAGSSANCRTNFKSIPSNLTAVRNTVRVTGAGFSPTFGNGGLPAEESDRVDSSELLYAVMSRIWLDGEPATTILRGSEVGDTDDDGVLEVLDAWGDPIYFRLQVTIPLIRSDGLSGAANLGLDEYSVWMTGCEITDSSGFSVYDCTSFDVDVFSPERVRVAVASGNLDGFEASRSVRVIVP